MKEHHGDDVDSGGHEGERAGPCTVVALLNNFRLLGVGLLCQLLPPELHLHFLQEHFNQISLEISNQEIFHDLCHAPTF